MLINFLAFQTGWFACVLGAAHGLPWLGPLAAVPVLALSVRQAPQRMQQLQRLALVTLLGSTFDQAVLLSGWLSYPAADWPAQLLPPWMVALWALFATTLDASLRWLRQHLRLAALLGALSAPLAYYAGAQLGASSWHDPRPLLATLAVGWALLLPLLLRLAAPSRQPAITEVAHV